MESQNEHCIVDWIPGNKLRDAAPDILLILVLCTAVATSLYIQTLHAGNWFMRSGALMVLTGAILEYRNNSLIRRLDTTSIKWAKGFGRPTIFEPHPLRRAIAYIAHGFVIMGTFIAAYGDIVFIYLFE